MPNRKLAIGSVAVAIFIFLSASLNAYLIRTNAGGKVLWNAKEAYFFIGADTRGWYVNWIRYPFVMLLAQLGNVEPANDDRLDMHVIRVTSAGVERYVVNMSDLRPGSGPYKYTPIEGRIWAYYPAIGGLCWWARDHFEPATQDERRRIDPFQDLKVDFVKNEDGWAMRMVWVASFSIQLDDKVEVQVEAGLDGDLDPISIEMHKQDQEPIQIFKLERGIGHVTRGEYRRVFPERK